MSLMLTFIPNSSCYAGEVYVPSVSTIALDLFSKPLYKRTIQINYIAYPSTQLRLNSIDELSKFLKLIYPGLIAIHSDHTIDVYELNS